MDSFERERIVQDARSRRVRELARIARRALRMLVCMLVHEPAVPSPSRFSAPSPAERVNGLANFQERLKNSRPPRIAVIRSISRSKCSGTSTKFKRSLFTMSSGLSE